MKWSNSCSISASYFQLLDCANIPSSYRQTLMQMKLQQCLQFSTMIPETPFLQPQFRTMEEFVFFNAKCSAPLHRLCQKVNSACGVKPQTLPDGHAIAHSKT